MAHILPLIAPLVYLLFWSQLSFSGPTLAYCQPPSGPTGRTERKENRGHNYRDSNRTFVDPAGPSHSYYTLHQLLNKLLNEYQLTFLTKGQEQYLNHPEELTDDRTKYQATLSNGDINYTTKEGVKVMTVLYDHEPVWSHDPVRDRDEYPLKVVLNFNLGVLSVNTHSRTHLYLFDNNRWVHRLTTDLRSSSTPLLSLDCLYPSGSFQKKEELQEELEDEVQQLEESEDKLEKEEDETLTGPKEVKVTTEDSNGNIHVNDAAMYSVTKLDNDMFEYTFNTAAKCTMVAYEGKEVWRHREGSFHPDSVTYNRGERRVTLWFDSDHTSYQMSSDGKWYIWTSTLPLESSQYPPEITLTTIDSDGTLAENHTNGFTVYKFFQSTYMYKFNKDCDCTRITHQGKEVWRYESGLSYPASLSYNSRDDSLILYFGDAIVKYNLNKDGSWVGHSLDLEKDP